MPRRIPAAAEDIPPDSTPGYPEPFRTRMGRAHWRALGDHFGLSQFGVSLETLEPGAQSSVRHWHSLADEFVYMVAGELALRTDDGEFLLTPGMCIGFQAGDRNAHHLVNKSGAVARFMVVGSRVPGDLAFYPDDDLALFVTGEGRVAVHKDGTPYPPAPGKG
jgi:uncharacterized cupin superfamily protein